MYINNFAKMHEFDFFSDSSPFQFPSADPRLPH